MEHARDNSVDLERPPSNELILSSVSYTVPGLRRKDPPREVLSNVSARFPSAQLSAVMGASGCGKTTMLTLLRGLTSKGSVLTGRLTCNSKTVTAAAMRRISSLVPQADVYLSALTPREVLDFAAQLRMPRTCSAQDRNKQVADVLSLLHLEPCANTRIGDGIHGSTGISGGERKRLSVGLSIIGGLPQVLLCDEPTSGLDSAVASLVVDILKDLVRRGVTVVCTIHQPSYAMFSEFSQLLMLHAGKVAYHGQVADVESFFAQFDAATPQHVNPAHHYISELQQHGDVWVSRCMDEGPLTQKCIASPEPSEPANGKANEDAISRSSLSMIEQTCVLMKRVVLENFRNRSKFRKGVMARLPASTLIGIFFWQMARNPSTSAIFALRSLLFITIQNAMVDTFYAGATTFQATRHLLKREYYDGLYQMTPFYLSYYFGFLLMQIPWTLVWALPLYFLTGMPLEVDQCLVFVSTCFVAILLSCAFGSAVGTWTKDEDGNRAVLLPMMIVTIMLSGFIIQYHQLHVIWLPFYYLSPIQWCMSILEKNLFSGLSFSGVPNPSGSAQQCFATGNELLEATLNPVALRLSIPVMFLICIGMIIFVMVLNLLMIRLKVLNARA